MTQVLLTSISINELSEIVSEAVKLEMAKSSPVAEQSNKTNEATNDLITRNEAAKILGVSLPTLGRWTQDGTLTGYRINTRVRYKRAELEQSLKTICKHNH